jgi:hypothetical protein
LSEERTETSLRRPEYEHMEVRINPDYPPDPHKGKGIQPQEKPQEASI